MLIGALFLVVHPRHAVSAPVVATEPTPEPDEPPATTAVVPPEVPGVAEPAPMPVPEPEPPARPLPPEPVAIMTPLPPPIDIPPPAPPAPPQPAAPVAAERPVDHRYGTSIEFVDNPTDAAEQALKEKKLLFVLHVAGNFEKDCFT
jgi:hypothetical protein